MHVQVTRVRQDGPRLVTARPSVTPPEVWAPVWTSFRFSDENPGLGREYARSLFWDLPDFAADVVRDAGLNSEEWNALVESGGTYDVVGHRSYSLAGWRFRLSARHGRRHPAGTCPECFGTCVAEDTDGSVTGAVGTPFVCMCTQ